MLKCPELFVSPSLTLTNTNTGELIFALKWKKYGYFLFELHRDRIDAEHQAAFDHAWLFSRRMARDLGLPLYNIADVWEKAQQKLEDYARAGKVELDKTVDVEVEVFDHAFETTRKLTIGITLKKPRHEENRDAPSN